MRDLMNNITIRTALAPLAAAVADNTAQVGQIIDRAGFDSLTYAIATGILADADATFTVLLQDGDQANLSDAADVADVDLIGTEALAGFTFAADGVTRKLGYKGAKRYTRLTITPVGNAAAAPLSAVAILGHPGTAPTSNP